MPSPPSLALTFFEQFRDSADRVAFIRSLYDPADPTFEGDWLDFKTTRSDNLKDPKLQATWAEALSGFANNQGGVLVWGIDAHKRRGPDPAVEIDTACGERLVDNPYGLKSRLIELQRQATDPPLANVQIEACEDPGTPGKGFVFCFVPEGPFKAYRAEIAGKPHYYIRIGDSFRVAGPRLLRTLFYPRAAAVLQVRAELTFEYVGGGSMLGNDTIAMRCAAEVVNVGNATARNAYLVMRTNFPDSELENTQFSDAPDWSRGRTKARHFTFDARRPLHPELPSALFDFQWLTFGRAVHDQRGNPREVPGCANPSFVITAYAENQEAQRVTLEFDVDELIEKGQCSRAGCPDAGPLTNG